MPVRTSLLGFACAAALITAASSAGAVVYSYVDISSYANNNIFTDLNQNFPTTGSGVPGSHTGTANATFVFTPWTYTPPGAGSATVPFTTHTAPLGNNGVSFQLNSNASGQDFVQIGASGPTGYTGPNPVTVAMAESNVTTVYLLMGSYTGQSFSVTINGSDGAQTFSNISLPDFYGGSEAETCSGGVCVGTVYTVSDVGAGGSGNSTTGFNGAYDMTEVAITLSSAENVTSAEFTSNGYETLLFGITTAGLPIGAPEPSAWALMLTGFAGLGVALRSRRRTLAA